MFKCKCMCGVIVAGVLVVAALDSRGQSTARKPELEAVAETRLLMEGLASANFHGLERIFENKPTDRKYWVFARGQALLIAETANLLMMRPPRNEGGTVWLECAADMRKSATQLVYKIADQNYQESRTAIIQLGNSCNRCHQSFRVPVRITPFEKQQ